MTKIQISSLLPRPPFFLGGALERGKLPAISKLIVLLR